MPQIESGWHVQRGRGQELKPPHFGWFFGGMSTFVDHSGEMSRLPAPCTSNQTASGWGAPPLPHLLCAVHATAD